MGGLNDVRHEYADASQAVRAAKTWWVYPSTEEKRLYDLEVENANKVKVRLDELVRERDEVVSEAKKSVGLFSSFGVSETRNLFWDSFESGKAWARRMTMYDVLFVGIRATSRRDDGGIVGFLLQVCVFCLSSLSLLSVSPLRLSALSFPLSLSLLSVNCI